MDGEDCAAVTAEATPAVVTTHCMQGSLISDSISNSIRDSNRWDRSAVARMPNGTEQPHSMHPTTQG